MIGILDSSGPTLNQFFNSGDNFGITLDGANYVEGSKVTGSFGFNLTKDVGPIDVHCVLVGQEQITFVKKRIVRNNMGTDKMDGQTLCCNHKALVMQSNESFSAGNYSYPFQFDVPEGIPGTYGHKQGEIITYDLSYINCQYFLYIELNTSGQGGHLIGRAASPITIMQRPRSPIQQNVVGNISKTMRSCCVSKGNININCTLSKDAASFDEGVNITYSVDNSGGKQDITKLVVVLERNLLFRNNSGNQKEKINNVLMSELPGCGAGQMINDQMVNIDLRQSKDPGTSDHLTAELGEFAGMTQQSCNGNLFECSYTLSVIAQTGSSLSGSPKVVYPITIYAPDRNTEGGAQYDGGSEMDSVSVEVAPAPVQAPAPLNIYSPDWTNEQPDMAETVVNSTPVDIFNPKEFTTGKVETNGTS